MTNFTNKVVKQLTYHEQKEWHNKNNWSIFQSVLVANGATTYKYPMSDLARADEKLSFSGNMREPWQQIGQDIDGETFSDQSGRSLSMSADGSIVAIGAPYNDGFDGTDSRRGHVRVYEFKEGSWNQKGVDIDGEAAGDESGTSVSLSADGTIVAIGAPCNDGLDGTDSNRGHVRVYEFKEGSWNQKGVDIDGEAAEDESGYSVSLSADGSVVAIGAPYNDGLDGTDSIRGHVRVYEYDGSSWNQKGTDIDGEAPLDESGYSVSLSADGSIVAIGAKNNHGNGSKSGHVRVYEFKEGSWEQLGGDIDGEATGDYSGFSVSLSADGSIVAIGAHLNDGFDGTDSWRGHVRVYEYDGSSWNQKGTDIDGEAAGDVSGLSVSLSADGSVVAIGAHKNDGIDGTDSNRGHVRVYQYDGSIWEKIGEDIDGEATGDHSGRSVSLSANGSIVAIGAAFVSSNRGHVRVYRHNVLSGISQINHFNANPAAIAKNIMVSRYGPQWEQVGADIDGKATGDKCGYSVSLSADGMVMAIGSPGPGYPTVGQVRIFEYNGVSWQQRGGDFNGIPIKEVGRGHSVFLNANGSYVAMGSKASHSVDGNTFNVGIVRIYQYVASKTQEDENGPSGWNIVGQEIEGQNQDDYSGRSVSLSSDGLVVAIGATSNSGSGQPYSGHVRVYKYNGTDSWIKEGGDIHGESSYDNSGYSVSLSADGSIVAIGARWNDGTSGNNNDKRGSVRVYKYNGTDSWIKRGGDIDGEATGDESGHSVSLSADGSIVAIGAINNDSSGSNSGHVRVYRNNPEKVTAVTDETMANYGPIGWDRLGGDIDGESAEDQSGWYVSLSADGKVVAICAIDNDGSGSNSGHVRVYEYDASKTESQLENQQLENYGPVGWNRIGGDIDGVAQGDESGHSVSLNADGSVVAIGSPGTSQGTVRVYQIAKRNLWVQQGLDIDGESAGDESGLSTSLSSDGSLLAIGSYMANGTTGNVRVYRNESGLWKQVGSNIEGGQSGEYSGAAISLTKNGSVLAISADGYDNNRGKVRVFENNNDSWTQLGFDIDGEAQMDQSGWSVSCVDGRDENKPLLLAIGAVGNDGNGDSSGHVRVYQYKQYNSDNDSGKIVITQSPETQPINDLFYWIQVGQDIDGEGAGDRSGVSVSFSSDGTTLAIGAEKNDNDNGFNSGHVSVYRFNVQTNNWGKFGDDIDGQAAHDQSGASVALNSDGTILAIGALYNDGNDDTDSKRGHVRVYNNISGSWQQIGSDIDGEGRLDLSGTSVSLSSDGTILAIGALYNDGNGTDSGHVRVYRYLNGEWNQIGSDIDGEASDDLSGCSVSLNDDGTIMAIGAQFNDGNGSNSGHVRVYKFTGWGL